MIDLQKDKKGDATILTQTDSEGFHKQISLSPDEIKMLIRLLS